MAELVSKNSFFNFNEKTLKQKRRIALGTKFAPAYSILFLEDFMISHIYGGDIFFYLQTWGRKVKDLYKNPQWNSSNNKVYCSVVIEINRFFRCCNFSDRRPNWNIRKILEGMHILPTPDEQLRKIFADIPRIGFKNGKSLMDHIVRSVLP